MKLSVTVKACP
nr:unnamed protein product [Timema bartmani]